jgi:hypothetical protein
MSQLNGHDPEQNNNNNNENNHNGPTNPFEFTGAAVFPAISGDKSRFEEDFPADFTKSLNVPDEISAATAEFIKQMNQKNAESAQQQPIPSESRSIGDVDVTNRHQVMRHQLAASDPRLFSEQAHTGRSYADFQQEDEVNSEQTDKHSDSDSVGGTRGGHQGSLSSDEEIGGNINHQQELFQDEEIDSDAASGPEGAGGVAVYPRYQSPHYQPIDEVNNQFINLGIKGVGVNNRFNMNTQLGNDNTQPMQSNGDGNNHLRVHNPELSAHGNAVLASAAQDGTFTWPIENFDKVRQSTSNNIQSPTFKALGLEWRILFFPNGMQGIMNFRGFMAGYIQLVTQLWQPTLVHFRFVCLHATDASKNKVQEASNEFWRGSGEKGFNPLFDTDELPQFLHADKNNAFVIRVDLWKPSSGEAVFNLPDSKANTGYLGVKNQGGEHNQ